MAPVSDSLENPAMVLVQVLSDDKVWAHLLAANLRARNVSSRVGDISWIRSGDDRLSKGSPMILDLGSQDADGLDEYASLIEDDRGEWDRIIAVANVRWMRHLRSRSSSISVVQRHADMRKLLPEIMELITDRQAAGL